MYEQENYNTNFQPNSAVIKVMGIGGGGCNAINSMIDSNVGTAEFYAVNTDSQALLLSKAGPECCIQIGNKLTKGLGAGSNPIVGEEAAKESNEEISKILEGTDLLFIAAGMGGGTGTGAAPVIAKIAKDKGILTVAVVTKPFAFEGKVRNENANKGIAQLKEHVDTLVVIPNDKLIQFLPAHTGIYDAFKIADDMLKQAIVGIVDLIATPSLINLDFADVRTVMHDQGLAHMGIGRSKGDKRIVESVRQAISSPLLETTIEGAKSVILNVTGGKDLTLGEVTEAANIVQGIIDEEANIIFGATIDPEMSDEVKITVIATGFYGAKQNGLETKDFKLNTSFADIEESVVPPIIKGVEYQEQKVQAVEEKVKEPEVKPIEQPVKIPRVDEPLNYPNSVDEDKDVPTFMRRLFKKK